MINYTVATHRRTSHQIYNQGVLRIKSQDEKCASDTTAQYRSGERESGEHITTQAPENKLNICSIF